MHFNVEIMFFWSLVSSSKYAECIEGGQKVINCVDYILDY